MTFADFQQQFQIYFLERRQLVIAIILVAAGLMLWVVGILPLWTKVSGVRRQLTTSQTNANKVNVRSQLLQKLSQEDHDNFARVEAALPLQKQPFTSLLILNEVASESGAVLSRYDLDPGVVSTGEADPAAQSGEPVLSFTLTANVRGNLSQLQDLFSRLEKSLPLFEVTEFSMTPLKITGTAATNEATSSAQLLDSDITLRTFYAPLQTSQFAKVTAQPLTPGEVGTLKKLQDYALISPSSTLVPQGVEFNNPDYFQAKPQQ